MEKIVANKIIDKKRKNASAQKITNIKARMMTMGGALIFAIIIILTLVFILNFIFPRGNGLQFVIIIALAFIGWGFFLNCISERLKITDEDFEFTSLIGRTVRISLDDILSYKLTDLGVRLDGNMYLLEVEHTDKSKPEEIWLSPCWDYKELSAFCSTLGQVLDEFNSQEVNNA
jgi:hypothetical protein